MKPIKQVTVVRHFGKNDPDCTGFCSVVDVCVGDEVVASYGYLGLVKATSFIAGLRHCNPGLKLKYVHVSDKD